MGPWPETDEGKAREQEEKEGRAVDLKFQIGPELRGEKKFRS